VAELLRGGYDPRIITVRELLHHTSGLFDYSKSPDYAKAVLADPAHRWTRAEQLAFAVDHGRPYGRPGERYHYSDTGYILLGEILERATSLSLGAAVRTLLELDRLGIRYTWFETLDSVPPGAPALAHQYLDSLDLSRFDPSPDLYGGGGLVSNADELARFYRALVRGQVLRRAETLDLMLTPSSRSLEQQPDAGYGMGIGRGGLDSVTCYGHSGFLGTVARTCPAIDLTVAGSMNRSPDSAFTVARVAAAAMALVLPAIEKARADSSR
jgi:D-alanyl-D-alanine carboxypeptidase